MAHLLVLLVTVLQITLLDAGGQPVVGVTVTFHLGFDDEPVASCQTDANGYCEMIVEVEEETALVRGSLHVRDADGRALGNRSLTWPPRLVEALPLELRLGDDGQIDVPHGEAEYAPEDALPQVTRPPALSPEEVLATVAAYATAAAPGSEKTPPAPRPTPTAAAPHTPTVVLPTVMATETPTPTTSTFKSGQTVFTGVMISAAFVLAVAVYLFRDMIVSLFHRDGKPGEKER